MLSAPASPSAAPRKRRRLYRSLALLLVLLIGGAIALPWLLYHFEHRQFEREAGPLRSARFARPKLPPGNPAARLLQAAALVRLVDTENKDVGDGARRGYSKIRANRAQYAVLLERNREALRLALALGGGPSALNIDYAALDPPIPDLFRQVQLARLVYIQGLFALEGHDEAGVAAAARSLGLQATVLQRETAELTQRFGLYEERLQLSLLQSFVQEAPAGGDAGLERLLLSSDLRGQYRATITLSAAYFIRSMDRLIAHPDPNLEKASTPEDEVANAMGRAAGRWTTKGLAATALGRYRLYFRAYDEDYAWIDRELGKDPKEMSTFEKLGNIGCIRDDTFPALFRATAASRVLMANCLAVHAGSLACEEANKVSRNGVHLRSSRRPDGTCVVRTADGKEFLRFFRSETSDPVPQDCSVLAAR